MYITKAIIISLHMRIEKPGRIDFKFKQVKAGVIFNLKLWHKIRSLKMIK